MATNNNQYAGYMQPFPQTQQVFKQIGDYFFDLNDKLGEGTFGKVYKGKSKLNEAEVAIKVISQQIINGNKMMENLLVNEIEIMKALKSRNVVKLIDIINSANNVYIIQEFCRGGDLRKFMVKRKCIPEEEALDILKDILSGFKELVKAGVVHRDLKPENILINDGVYKIADFGLARYVNNFKKDLLKTAVGTPLYMSPQIHFQAEYSSKSEIWSIGLIYYELLYGKIPWDFTNQTDLVENMCTKKVEFPDYVEVSEDSKRFLQKALSLDEKTRLSWDQVFEHPLFENYFHHKEQLTMLDKRARGVLNKIREKITLKKVNVEALFEKFNYKSDSALDLEEFSKFFTMIDNDLKREEIEYLFNRYDLDGDNSISFKEFQKVCREPKRQKLARAFKNFFGVNRESGSELRLPNDFNRHDSETVVKDVGNPIGRKNQEVAGIKIIGANRKETTDNNNALEESRKNMIMKVAREISTKKIDLKRQFYDFDKNFDDKLNREEFRNFMLSLYKDLSEDDIGYLFTLLDVTKNELINLNKIREVLENPKYYWQPNPQIQGQQAIVNKPAPTTDQNPGGNKNFYDANNNYKQPVNVVLDKGGPINNNFNNVNANPRPNDSPMNIIERSKEFLKQLRKNFDEAKIEADKIFWRYDTNQDGLLQLEEFTFFINNIDRSKTAEDIKALFSLLDLQDKKYITKLEFEKVFGNPSTPVDLQPKKDFNFDGNGRKESTPKDFTRQEVPLDQQAKKDQGRKEYVMDQGRKEYVMDQGRKEYVMDQGRKEYIMDQSGGFRDKDIYKKEYVPAGDYAYRKDITKFELGGQRNVQDYGRYPTTGEGNLQNNRKPSYEQEKFIKIKTGESPVIGGGLKFMEQLPDGTINHNFEKDFAGQRPKGLSLEQQYGYAQPKPATGGMISPPISQEKPVYVYDPNRNAVGSPAGGFGSPAGFYQSPGVVGVPGYYTYQVNAGYNPLPAYPPGNDPSVRYNVNPNPNQMRYPAPQDPQNYNQKNNPYYGGKF